jgi:transposase
MESTGPRIVDPLVNDGAMAPEYPLRARRDAHTGHLPRSRDHARGGLSDSRRHERDVSAASRGGIFQGLPESVSPVRKVMEVLNEELSQADAHFAALVVADPVVQRLTTCPSIGPISAAAFVAAPDDIHRFDGRRGAAQVTSYLGLVPRECRPVTSKLMSRGRQSGSRRARGTESLWGTHARTA